MLQDAETRYPDSDAAAQGSAGQPEAPSAEPRDALLGTRIGGYRVTRELGRGGMGVVYLAHHEILNRAAAVKVLLSQYARHAEVSRRFVDEARAATRIPHPGVVQVFDVTTTAEGAPCIVMEYLQGQNLDRFAAGRKLAAAEAADLLLQLADVLGAAHEKGIVHRDVKPENILLVEQDGRRQVKLLDFGIARLDVLAPGVTVPGTVMGTPWYMAPEQIMGGAISPAADVYAAGVLGYRLLTGRLPFEADSLVGVLSHHLHTPVPHADELSTPLGAVVRRALSKTPEERFPNGHALRDAILAAVSRPAAAAKTPVGPLLTVEGRLLRLRFPDAASFQRVVTEEVARGRLYIATRTPLPDGPLRVCIESPAHSELSFDGEVVFRNAGNVGTCGLPPGAGLKLRRRAAEAQTPSRPATSAVSRVLAELESRNDADPYSWLGISGEAEMSLVKTALRKREAALEEAWAAAPEGQRERIAVLRAKLDRVRQRVATPEARARFDARAGNFRGVARCIGAGLGEEGLEPLRQEFANQFPERLKRAATEVLTADLQERRGQAFDALAALERALASDPLSMPLQRRYWNLKHRLSARRS